jgi:phytoene/squalene synthetase
MKTFSREMRENISSVYGFVRIADEIVDSFHDFDKKYLLDEFRKETEKAFCNGISVNPVLHSFQITAKKYNIPYKYINDFIDSMEMDLTNSCYDRDKYDKYVYGSAEVVGLMCLKVFCNNDDELFQKMIEPAKALGSAFQKVNFLRDIGSDLSERKRIYLPGATSVNDIDNNNKVLLEKEIEEEFRIALSGIKMLPKSCASGVYSAFLYYYILFNKIKRIKAKDLLRERVRISNLTKLSLLVKSVFEINFQEISGFQNKNFS